MKSKIILISIAIIIILAEAEIDIIVPSLPGLMEYYQVSAFEIELALSLNLIAHAIAGLWVGDLADKYGRKKILLLGISIFIFGSALTVFADNIYVLLMGRALQGAGMSAPMVVGFLIAIEGMSKSKQEARMALLNSIANIALAFTPAVGSIIAVFLGWYANFQFLLIFGLLSLVIAYYGLPRGSDKCELDERGRNTEKYGPLIRDKQVMKFIFSTTLLPAGWFTFVGVASIVYVEHFGLSLGEYGWHQGSIALLYGVSTVFIYKLVNILPTHKLVLASIASVLAAFFGLLVGFAGDLYSPLYISVMILIGSIGSIMLVNKTQLATINLKPDSAGKVSALITFFRWMLAAIAIQISSAAFNYSPTFAFILISFLWFAGVLLLCILMARDQAFKSLIMCGTRDGLK